MTATIPSVPVGDVLREWRKRRRLSQLDLALDADISARHLSFVEGGRSVASREMLLRLAERLGLPLRERNRLLLAGGYAPVFCERSLERPEMAAVMESVRAVLKAYEPFPALVVDRHWRLVAANAGLALFLSNVAPRLLEPTIDVLTLTLSADGLAPAIVNLEEWRDHVIGRVRRDAHASGDAELARLCEALEHLQGSNQGKTAFESSTATLPIAVPLVLKHPLTGVQLSFISTTTVFGTATDIALSELTLEGFLPADEGTRRSLMEKQVADTQTVGEHRTWLRRLPDASGVSSKTGVGDSGSVER